MSQVCVISIYVPDLQKAVDFYTNVLGFEVSKQYGPRITTLVHGDLPIVLEESEIAAYNRSAASGVVLGLKTENIHATLNTLKEHQVNLIVDEPTACPPGKFISFQDPFGNTLEYLQFE